MKIPGWLKRIASTSSSSAVVTRTINDALSRAGLTQGARSPLAATPFHSAPEPAQSADTGRFFWCSAGQASNTLDYKLFIPSSYERASTVALIVMMHGCTQDPDDFALGTRMNMLGEAHAAIVAYPQQTTHRNAQKCWNWFRPQDQQRDSGEPAQIAGMILELLTTYRIDPARVFVAGMSAGAAMALILAYCYPDLIAGAGVHSGLPYRCANNVASALSAMRQARSAHVVQTPLRLTVPLIVIHGDEDPTVDPASSTMIVRQAVGGWAGMLAPDAAHTTQVGGRSCRSVRFVDGS